jgi:hypothetical protein
MPRQNELKCRECEFLRKITRKHTMFLKMICKKYNIELETTGYGKEAYRCFACRNGGSQWKET